MQQGLIEIKIDNISMEETLRLRGIIHTLLTNDSLSLRNGRAIIHYDNESQIMKIEHEFIKWSKKHNT